MENRLRLFSFTISTYHPCTNVFIRLYPFAHGFIKKTDPDTYMEELHISTSYRKPYGNSANIKLTDEK